MRITIARQGEVLTAEAASPLRVSRLLEERGISFSMPCGGAGRCGKCRLKAEGELSPPSAAERRLLREEELAAGWRLACESELLGEARLFLPAEGGSRILTGGVLPAYEREPWSDGLGLAVDIGTTTLAAYLYDLPGGAALAEASLENPQRSFGADVVSRLGRSLEGEGAVLARAIAGGLDRLTGELARKAGRKAEEITAAVLVGNTAMEYLLTGEEVSSIAAAPFEASRLFGEYITAGALGLSGLAPGVRVYLARSISAYVGADITAAALAASLEECERPTLLVDIGTNGEMVLACGGEFLACSTAAGPAFEGAGIYRGCGAAPGAISKVAVQGGRLHCTTIGNAPAVGLCGSGVVDAAAALRRLEVLDETGRIDEDIAEEQGLLTEADGGLAVFLGDSGVVFTQKDARALQLAKAAIAAGIETLLHEAGLHAQELDALLIAGGFGSFLSTESAEAIGLIPEGMAACSRVLGNAAGMGASLMLQSAPLLRRSEEMARRIKTVELSSSAFFMESYVENMMFP